ncbi:MAG TPA: transposase [Salinimicrobium sp.]|nr:transposase [Salinimicrobium sp.]
MSKVRRISNFQHTFTFSSQTEQFDIFYQRFLQSDLGKIYLAVPWDELVEAFGLKEPKKGPASLFSPKGKLALMFLKHYGSCSDKRLVQQLNGNLEWQFFCDLYLGKERLKNYKVVSEVRCELAKKLDIDQIQQVFYKHWSPHIEDKHSITTDATCYESHLRYPTNVKLLWECVDWLQGKMKTICKEKGEPLPRTKYLKWKKRYISYSKMRRKTKKKRKAITRSLLLLLDKINGELDRLEKDGMGHFSANYHKRRAAAKKVFAQQHAYFHKEEKPKNRIVSIDRPYIRPIVRGKEVKPVEFGAKVNKFQIDGIGFVEHLSFEAFHEGNRLIDTIFKAQRLTHVKTKLVGADAIYATNKNRKFITSHDIQTDFKRKGKAGKHENQRKKLAGAITRERASRLEGSFGKDKEHYHLKRIKARTKATEKLWIFFGIHTGNALEIGRRMMAKRLQEAA